MGYSKHSEIPFLCQNGNHTVSNSYFWTDLNQIISLVEMNLLDKENLLSGLKNSIGNGFEIKMVGNNITNQNINQGFNSIEEIITYVANENYNRNDFYVLLIQTINFGFNLVNSKIMERSEIYRYIDGERDYQDTTWSPRRKQLGVPDESKSIAEWIIYMEYHLNKAKENIYRLDSKESLAEIRKITALGVRTMEIYGCPKREL